MMSDSACHSEERETQFSVAKSQVEEVRDASFVSMTNEINQKLPSL